MSSFFRKNREQDQPRWQKKQTAINSQNDRFTIYAHMQPQKCKQAHEYQKSSQFSQNFSCIQKRNNDDDPVIHCKVNKMKQTLKSFQVLNDSQYRLQNISRKNEYPNRSSQLPSNQSSIQRSNKNLQSTQQRAQKNMGYYPQKIQTQQNEQNNEQLQDQIQQNYNKQINYNAKLDQMQYRLSMICQKQQQNKFDQLIANPDAYTNPNTNLNTNTNKYSRSPYSQYSHHNSQQSTKRQQFKTKKSSEYSYSGKHIIKQLKAEKQAKNNRNLNIQKSKNTVPIPTIIHEDDQEMDLQNVKIASTMQVHPYGKKNYADIFQDSRKNSPYPTNNANINKNRSYQLEKDMKNKSRQYLNADQDGGRSQGGAWKIQLMRQSRQNAHTGTGNNRYRQQNQLYSNNSESIANEQQQKSHKKSTSTNLHGRPNPNPNSNNNYNYNISHSHSLSNSHAHINPSKYSIADMDIDREREKYGQRHMETGTWAKEGQREWSQAEYKQNFNQYNHMEQLTTKRKELAQRITYLDKNTSKHQQQTKQKYNYSQNRNSSKTNKSQKSINKSIQKLHNSTSSNKQAIQKKSNSNSFNNLKNQKSNSTSKPISKQKPKISHEVIYVQPHHLPLQSKNPKINHITFSNNRSSVSHAAMAPRWHKTHRGPIVQILFLSQQQFVTASTDYSIQFHHIQFQIQNQNHNNISSSTLYRHRSAINSIVNIDNTIYSVSNDMYLKKCTIELSSNLHGSGQGQHIQTQMQMHDEDMFRMEHRPLHLLAIDQMSIMIGCINKLYVFDVVNWNIVTDIPIQVSVGQEYRLLGNGHQIYVADTQLITIGQFGDRRAGRNVPIKLGIDYGSKDEDNRNVKWIMHQTQDICYRIINNKFYKVDFKNKSPSPFPSQPSLQIPSSQKMISHCWPQTQSPMPMLTVLTHQHMQTNIIKNRLLQLNLQTNFIQQIYTGININTNMDNNGQDIDYITGMHNAFNIVRESGGIYFIGDKSGRIVTISSGKYRDGNSGVKGAIKNRQRVNTYL